MPISLIGAGSPWAIDFGQFTQATQPYLRGRDSKGNWMAQPGQAAPDGTMQWADNNAAAGNAPQLRLANGQMWQPSGAGSGITFQPKGYVGSTFGRIGGDDWGQVADAPTTEDIWNIGGDLSPLTGQPGANQHIALKYHKVGNQLVPMEDPKYWNWQNAAQGPLKAAAAFAALVAGAPYLPGGEAAAGAELAGSAGAGAVSSPILSGSAIGSSAGAAGAGSAAGVGSAGAAGLGSGLTAGGTGLGLSAPAGGLGVGGAGLGGSMAGAGAGIGALGSGAGMAEAAGSWIPGISNSTALSVGGNLIGGLYGAYQAKQAAGAQSDAAQRAMDMQAPFLKNGLTGQNRLMDLLGLSGNKSADGYGSAAKTFGAAEFQAGKDPGYDWRMKQGQQALDRAARASGGMGGGGYLKDAMAYNQGLASQEFQNSYNRFQTDRASILNPLQSLSGQGQSAANTMGGYAVNQGDAAAAGRVGSANAITGGISSAINGYNQNNMIQQLLGRGSGYVPMPTFGMES